MYQVSLSHALENPLEYIYLSGITGNSEYKDRVMKIRTLLKNTIKQNGLNQSVINSDENWESVWKPALYWHDSAFFYNLLRSNLQSNGRDLESLAMYREVIDALIEAQVFKKSNENYDYATKVGKTEMHNYDCYLGAMLSRGAQAINHSLADHRSTATRHQELAQGITRTCYTATNRTKTGLTSYYTIKDNKFGSDNPSFLRDTYFYNLR